MKTKVRKQYRIIAYAIGDGLITPITVENRNVIDDYTGTVETIVDDDVTVIPAVADAWVNVIEDENGYTIYTGITHERDERIMYDDKEE